MRDAAALRQGWSHDGRELFYVNGTSMMAAAVGQGATVAFDRPVRLFDGVDFAAGASPYAVAADGRFLLVEEAGANSAQRTQLTLVLNWVEDLKRRVPATPLGER